MRLSSVSLLLEWYAIDCISLAVFFIHDRMSGKEQIHTEINPIPHLKKSSLLWHLNLFVNFPWEYFFIIWSKFFSFLFFCILVVNFSAIIGLYVGLILAPSCVIVLSSYVSSTWAKCSLSRGFLNCRFFCAVFFRFGANIFFVPWSCIDRMPKKEWRT